MDGHTIRYLMAIIFSGRPPLPPGIRVGKSVLIDATARLDWIYGRHITLGNNVTIGDGARILCHDGSSYERIHAIWVAPVHIGDRAYIGSDSLVLPGVNIGSDAVVAAGAVVSEDVPPSTVVAGVPAKPIGNVNEIDRKRIEMMKRSKCFEINTVRRPRWSDRKAVEEALREAAEQEGGYFLIQKFG